LGGSEAGWSGGGEPAGRLSDDSSKSRSRVTSIAAGVSAAGVASVFQPPMSELRV